MHSTGLVIYGKAMGKQGRIAPQKQKTNKVKLKESVAHMLTSLGHPIKGELKSTPSRVSSLWADKLLCGENLDVANILKRPMKTQNPEPIIVTNLGIHMVCPHHLTVAFGEAHLAYLPNDHIVGFGTLSKVVEAACAKIILQEDATKEITNALLEHLSVKAAVCVIQAVHPCHRILHPKSQKSEAITWASSGQQKASKELRSLLKAALSDKKS